VRCGPCLRVFGEHNIVDTPDLAVVGFKLRLADQPDPTMSAGSSGGPVLSVTRGEREVIVILTDPALIDRISPDL